MALEYLVLVEEEVDIILTPNVMSQDDVQT